MLQGSTKIRRGKRTDFPALMTLLTSVTIQEPDKVQARYWRRLASDPAHDFYVAEQEGRVRGMVLVSYTRSLTDQRWQAIFDLIAPVSTACDIAQELLNFAKLRARKRGCRHLLVWVKTYERQEQLAFLLRAGFLGAGEVLSCELQ
jgi:N-acetylglutamate synthase-like GNAT family acetyltransferase